MQRLMLWIRRIKLSRRISVFSLIMSTGPLLLLGGLSYQIASGAAIAKIVQSTQNSLVMARMNLETTVERLEGYSIEIAFSEPAQAMLSGFDTLDAYRRFSLERQMHQESSKLFTVSNFISDVLLITQDLRTAHAYQRRTNNLNLSPEYLATLTQQIKKSGNRSVFSVLSPSQALVSGGGVVMARMVNNIDTGEHIGYILIAFDESYLRRICEITSVSEGGFTLIVDQNNTVVSGNAGAIPSGSSFFDRSITTAMFLGASGTLPEDVTVDNERYRMSVQELLPERWFMVNLIPYRYLMQENRSFLWVVSVTVGVCVLLALMVATLISKSVNDPLQGILSQIDRVNQGQFTPDTQAVIAHDEISTVAESFNHMVELLQKLMDDIRAMEKQRHELEFQALCAQINPHFLSNTLGSLKWMAEMQGADNIAQLSDALCQMLSDVMVFTPSTTIEKEIEFQKQYVLIQQYRYLDKFSIRYDLDPETLSCVIPRFILQPLLENAIIHGVAPKKGHGRILISCHLQGEQVRLFVEDDGAGIPAETVLRLESGADDEVESASRFGSIGLQNTMKRFHMHYGEGGSFCFEQPEGGGTRIVLLFPATQEEGMA